MGLNLLLNIGLQLFQLKPSKGDALLEFMSLVTTLHGFEFRNSSLVNCFHFSLDFVEGLGKLDVCLFVCLDYVFLQLISFKFWAVLRII